jgi:hypothetical protein
MSSLSGFGQEFFVAAKYRRGGIEALGQASGSGELLQPLG